ncbi:hypothetical protein PTTG_05857 [Puccinia triticina 1-1 BBBD Race 1]|uniref:Uncharacterized protein n=2 Tax=Puccinia triticina TaxID=208348 RepID=A0A180GB60_PUCT1|nr:uncharacterized protein PtA15_6A384 [Puccinia triticina]OAV89582.1 hypothetical protein PTTG_05857 [Puccinia triticina 1-1 BBBD Race 1]WAQ85755.1 hypothetical protein PtA15_6A384 [Puccinia triticina]
MEPSPPLPAEAVQEPNPPLGSQPEHYHRPENFIDLTIDEDPLPDTNTASENRSGANGQDGDDDDIIIISESHPRRPSNPRQAPRNSSSSTRPSFNQPSSNRPSTTSNPIGAFTNLPGPMAALTANIYAGHFSRHARGDPPPQQGSSNLTVRETRPPQTRRPNPTGLQFGGGGRFSGGQFSGFLAAGLNGLTRLRGLATSRPSTPSTRRQPPTDSLHHMFSGWSSDEDFTRTDGARLISAQIHGGMLPVVGRQIFAAIYDIPHAQEPPPPPYKVEDSHPLKIKSGFSKEIIPLDREVLSVESDNHPNAQPEKQELRPICAGCNAELLMGQDSCSNSSQDGRRPWILACGHVVDSRCLEQARTRALEHKAESNWSKKTRSAERLLNSHHPTRPGRPSKLSLAADSSSKLPNSINKRRKISSTHSAQKLQGLCTSPSSTSNVQAVSELALKRKERADAREARKSIDFTKPSPSSHRLLDSLHPAHPMENSAPTSNPTTTSSKNCKGKGKAQDELDALPSAGSLSISIPPTPSLLDQSSTIGNPPTPTESIAPTKKLAGSSAPSVSWIKCPVKGCRGAKGDLLAPAGSKNAPWEMFV